MRRWISYLPVLAVCAAPALCARADVPQWYLDTGAPVADTDGDGIPDAWERRTFGDASSAADAGDDRDCDGLTDLEEFVFGSDPRTFSTMGDGWSDKEKRGAGLGAGHRVVPAVSFAQWLDWLGCDAQAWQSLTATNAEGFAAAYAAFLGTRPPYSDTNLNGTVDFWLVTRTDRPALLTVGDALTTNSFPVRAGASRLRIRAAYGAEVSLSLDPHPGALAQTPGATNGAWLCGMGLEPCRSNTVVFADGETPPPVPGAPSGVNGLLVLSRPAADVQPLNGGPAVTAVRPLRVTNGISVLGDGFWCICSSEPPCPWPTLGMVAGACPGNVTVNGTALSSADDPLLDKSAARDLWEANQPHLLCTVTQTVASASYPFLYERIIFSFRPCLPRPEGAYGAEERGPRHEPGTEEITRCGGEGGVCTDGPAHFIGFSHSAVNTRNLYHPAESPVSDTFIYHCLGVVWDGQSIDLAGLCESCGLDLASLAVWEVNGTRQTSSLLTAGGEPPDLEPTVFRVKMLQASNPDIVWDRLFIVVNNRTSKTEYDNWVTQWSESANRIWLRELPDAFLRLGLNNSDPEPRNNEWFPPKPPPLFYHHTATFDMRSKRTIHDHGNQACYNSVGQIISSGVSAGTADYSAPISAEHVLDDVDPFIRALQLDGNPCRKNRMPVTGWSLGTQLDHAIIHQGLNADNYLHCRPPSAGVLEPETP